MWKIHLLKETSIRDMYKRRMTEYSKDCPSSENIEGERRLITEITNKTARECLGTKTKLRRKKAGISELQSLNVHKTYSK